MRVIKLAVLAFCLFVSIKAFAYISVGAYKYELHGDEAWLVGSAYAHTNIEIPISIMYNGKSYRVTTIGCMSYSHRPCIGESPITSLRCPGIVRICSSAFDCCRNLEFVEFGDSLKIIEESAFCECTKLSYVVIPANCYPHRYAFEDCTNLQYIIYLGNQTSKCGSNATVCYAKDYVHWSQSTFYYQGTSPTVEFSTNMPAGFFPSDFDLPSLEKDVGSYTLNVPFTFTNDDMSFNVDIPYSYTIKPIRLTAKVKDATRLYGDGNPPFSSTYTGFVNDEDASVITSHGSYSTATKKNDVGTYAIKQSGAMAKNYIFQYEDGTLTVKKAPLTMIANDKNMTYGSNVPTLDASYEGLKNNETVPAWTTPPTLTTTATKTSWVGNYPININNAEARNYDLTILNGILTIEKVPLTAKVDNKSRPYGEANPAFTLTYTGLKNNEAVPDWDQQPSFETEATTQSDVGNYPVSLKNAVAVNYDITSIDGTLTVIKAPLKVTPKDYTRMYAEQNPEFELLYEGLKNSENQPEWTEEPVVTTIATPSSSAGEYAIHVQSCEARNYIVEKGIGKLTVTKAPLSIKLKDATRKYGMVNPNFELIYTGLVNDETVPAWTTYPTISTTAQEKSDVGDYPITAEGGELKNYDINGIVPAVLTITPASLLIKAQDASRRYCEDNLQLDFVCTGFANGDNPTMFTTIPVVTTSATLLSPVGIYPIEVGGAEIKNYVLTYEKGQLTVNPRTLTVSTGDYTRAYGEENPAFVLNYKGFVNNEDENVLLAKPKASTVADKDTDTGVYDITIANGVAENYDFTYVGGKLTIEKAYQTLTWDQNLSNIALYDQIELMATASSGLEVEYNLVDNNVCSLVQIGRKTFLDCFGEGEAVISAIQGGNKNYWQTTKMYKPIKIIDTTGIDGLTSEQLATAHIYDLHGKRLNRLQKGVNIIRLADGTTKKVFVK